MKVLVKLTDNKSPLVIDGITINPFVESKVEKTENVKKAIRQGFLIFIKNVEPTKVVVQPKEEKEKPVNVVKTLTKKDSSRRYSKK
jgi:wobble nucleotide-excising tRNase